MLDGDYIAALNPFDYDDQNDLDYAYDLFHLLIQHHLAHGWKRFVLNGVFESSEQAHRLCTKLDVFGLPIATCGLTCHPETLVSRVRQRGRPNQEWEVQRARELAAILAEAARPGSLGTVVDTTGLGIQEVADRVQRDLQRYTVDDPP